MNGARLNHHQSIESDHSRNRNINQLGSSEPDPEIDPSLVLNASTFNRFLDKRVRRASISGLQSMDDEALQNLIRATTSFPGSEGGSTPVEDDMTKMSGLSASLPSQIPAAVNSSSPLGFSPSSHHVRARSYAGLVLSRVSRSVSKCKAVTNIRAITEPPKAIRNIVPVLNLGGEVQFYNIFLIFIYLKIILLFNLFYFKFLINTGVFLFRKRKPKKN